MSQELVFDAKLQSRKDLAWWLYIFHGLSLVLALGALSWIPFLVSIVKRSDAAGTFVYSHHTWQIRSFLWYVFWMFIGGVCWVTLIGIPLAILIWFAAWVWKAYRLIRGFLDLGENKPMPV